MSGDQIGDSFSGDDSFDDLDPSIAGDVFESLEKSFLTLDLSNLDSSSDAEIARTVAIFWRAYKRIIVIAFALLGVITSIQFINLIYLTPSVYSEYIFFGLIFLVGYLYPLRFIYGLLISRKLFAYLKIKSKILIFVSVLSLILVTVLSAYTILRDYSNYFTDSAGTCVMLADQDADTTYFSSVSCFSNRAYLFLDYETAEGEECRESNFGPYETSSGNFCLAEKRPPTEAELEILAK